MLPPDNKIKEFHDQALKISMLKYLLIIWLMSPMTMDTEIIWPTMLALFLTGTRLWTFCACNNFEIVHCALKILRSGMLIVPSSEFKVQPKNSRHWTGSQTHFSAFGTEPGLNKSDLISHPNSKARWKLCAQPKPSSIYIRTCLPSPLHLATKGRVSFVK